MKRFHNQVFVNGGEEIPPGGWRGGEEIPPGGWRADETDVSSGENVLQGEVVHDSYRTRDGRAHFTFDFRTYEDHVEVDAVYLPVAMSAEEKKHHFSLSPSGVYSLKIEDKIPDLSAAREYAADWAETYWSQHR